MSNTNDSATVVDFRIERLRRILKDGPEPAALAAAEWIASSGLAEAQYVLSQALLSSERPEDAAAARRWLEKAADQGHVPAAKELWKVLASEKGSGGARGDALPSMIRAADLGDYQASAVLIMVHGESRTAPVPNMLAYLERHVARGHAYAELALAHAFAMGHFGVIPDAARAFELYTLAAGHGDAHAQCCLGICYAYGLGVSKDDEQAVHWYREAALRGSAQAQCNLGYSYELGRKPCGQSMQEANRWYRRAALRDFSVAQFNLGQSYLQARALPKDVALANRWFARAAAQGLSSAQVALGYSYETGRGFEASNSRAVELYEAAAKAGDAQGQHNFAHMLQNGLGVERDLGAAARWYQAAAKQGLAVARDNLATMYIEGAGVEKDLAQALMWRRLAADQGLANAQFNLAWMYEKGVGVERDASEALRWCQAAAAQGHASAAREIDKYRNYLSRERELADARAALNALEVRLRKEDPAYEAKRAIVVPLLKPVLERLPPSQWLAVFERAYADAELPRDDAGAVGEAVK